MRKEPSLSTVTEVHQMTQLSDPLVGWEKNAPISHSFDA